VDEELIARAEIEALLFGLADVVALLEEILELLREWDDEA
jgi:hypothetical protein